MDTIPHFNLLPKVCSTPGATVSLAVKEIVTISANIGQGSEVQGIH